jgi:hypothetical protein
VYVARDPVTVNLTGLQSPDKARAEWIDTWTCKTEKATLQPTPVQRLLRKPEAFGDAPALLVIR